ncbi:MAG: YajQ family cyclic di-GMP-binding protein [Succinivibrionaceae bacterium]|nr:YajQ family cyclic di-GMP-binding protein [Succinivibrionaceae bacterium]
MPSFDVVSEIKKDELQNAVENANRELLTRYDFRGVEASFTLNKEELSVKMEAAEEFQVQQMEEMFRIRLSKRGIAPGAAEYGEICRSGKKSYKVATFKEGIDKELGKKVIAIIKKSGLKVDPRQNGEVIRVTGKKRDDLQAAIALIKGADIDKPLQFENFHD